VPALFHEPANQCGDYRMRSVKLVEQAVTAAKTFKSMNETQMAALLAKTNDAAQNGEFEGTRPRPILTVRRTIPSG